MAGSGGYVVKIRGKRAANGAEEVLYLDLARLVLASDDGQGIAVILEGGERVSLAGTDADWVRAILDEMAQPRKVERGHAFLGGQR